MISLKPLADKCEKIKRKKKMHVSALAVLRRVSAKWEMMQSRGQMIFILDSSAIPFTLLPAVGLILWLTSQERELHK